MKPAVEVYDAATKQAREVYDAATGGGAHASTKAQPR
jgi:hypothetical protein